MVAPWVRRAVDGTAVHRRRVAIRCFDTLVWKPWHLMAKDAMYTVWLVGGIWRSRLSQGSPTLGGIGALKLFTRISALNSQRCN